MLFKRKSKMPESIPDLGASEMAEEIETPEAKAKRELLEHLSLIAQVVGADFGMKIDIGEPGTESVYDSATGNITFSPDDIGEDIEIAEFVAAHEGSHRAISLGPVQMGIPKKDVIEMYGQTGFRYMHNIVEDATVNSWLDREFPGIEPCTDKYYDGEIESLDQYRKQAQAAEEDELAQVDAMPKFRQFGFEILRRWHQGWDTTDDFLPQDINEAVESIIEDAQKSVSKQPRSRKKYDVLRNARARFVINTEKIWPVMKQFVEEDIKEEALDKLAKDAAMGGGANRGLSDRTVDEILDQIKSCEASEDEDGQQTAPKPLSERAQKELQELFDTISDEERQERLQQAEQVIKELEDELNEQLQGKLNQDLAPSHQELDAQAEAAANNTSQSNSLPFDISDKLIERMLASESEYDRIYRQVSPLIDDLYRKLEPVFVRNRHPRWQKGFTSGQRVDLMMAMQAEAKEELKLDIWERKEVPHKRSYRGVIIMDLSGSMQGESLEQCKPALIVDLEALDLLGVETMLIGVGDRAWVIKDFGDKLDAQMREQISKQLVASSSITATYEATKIASDALKNHPSTDDFVITITDGAASYYEELKGLVKTMSQKREAYMYGIFIGGNSRYIEETYPNSLVMSKFDSRLGSPDNFSTKMSDLVKQVVLNPESIKT